MRSSATQSAFYGRLFGRARKISFARDPAGNNLENMARHHEAQS